MGNHSPLGGNTITPVMRISTSVGTHWAEPCLEYSQKLKQCLAEVLEYSEENRIR